MTERGVWVAVLVGGHVQASRVVGRECNPISVDPSQLHSGTTPPLIVKDDLPRLVTNPTAEASAMAHPVPLNVCGKRLALAGGGAI
jgi:hypothetical protein